MKVLEVYISILCSWVSHVLKLCLIECKNLQEIFPLVWCAPAALSSSFLRPLPGIGMLPLCTRIRATPWAGREDRTQLSHVPAANRMNSQLFGVLLSLILITASII